MQGVTQSFVAPINEWYSWNPSSRNNPAVKVLMTLDRSNFPLGVKNFLNGGDVPVAWSNTSFKMVYLNYGHGDRTYSGPHLTRITDNSLNWLLSQQK
jgi:type 1 glutamine amidotransferase